MFSQKATGLDELLHRPRPSPWERFWRSPTLFLGQLLYAYSRSRPAVSNIHEKPVTVVCVSDTHNSQPELPDGDVLVHAGDLTQSGTFVELQSAIDWLRRQPHRHKVVIAGNHDILLDPASNHRLQRDGHRETREDLDWGDVTYLQDTATTLTCANGRRLRVYGSPWSPRHGSWAFQYPRVKNIWSHAVPDNIDILITHSPPRGHLDLAGLGCVHLLGELWRLRPRLHVFGHVHEGYGKEGLVFDGLQAAFERLIICGGGIASLLGVVKEAISSRLAGDGVVQTILVNAAVVGGLRDKMKRQPIVFTI